MSFAALENWHYFALAFQDLEAESLVNWHLLHRASIWPDKFNSWSQNPRIYQIVLEYLLLCICLGWRLVIIKRCDARMHVFLHVYHPHFCVNLQINAAMFPHLTIKCIFRTQVTIMKVKTLNISDASTIRRYIRYCLKIASSKAISHSHINRLQDWPPCLLHVLQIRYESLEKWK